MTNSTFEKLSTKKLVETAIKMEMDTQNAFIYYSKRVANKSLKETFQKIAINEKMHITMITDLFKKRFRKEKWILGVDDYFHPFLDVKRSIDTDKDVLKNALDFEIKAMKFYELLESRLAGIFREIITYLRFFKEKHYFLLNLEQRKMNK